MRILYISSAKSLGGGERHLADLANGMARLGHEVFVALRPSSPLVNELQELPKQNLRTLPLRNALDAGSARELSKLVHRHGIQVVHAHMARDYPLAAYAARIPNAKLVVTRHVLFALNRLHRMTLARARVIAVSQAVASQLLSSNIVSPDRLTVVYNGIDVTRFASARARFDRRQFLRDWKFPEDSVLVGTVGEITALKGQREFVQAAVQVLEKLPAAYFLIAGTDHSQGQANATALDELISELNLHERVRRVPWLEDIAQLYCALDVFVSASFTESFGLAIAEAMACATAVVATETAGAKEIIQAEKTGLMVPVGNVDKLSEAILKLLCDKNRRLDMGQQAQLAVAEKFGIDTMIEETERIYREEIGQ